MYMLYVLHQSFLWQDKMASHRLNFIFLQHFFTDNSNYSNNYIFTREIMHTHSTSASNSVLLYTWEVWFCVLLLQSFQLPENVTQLEYQRGITLQWIPLHSSSQLVTNQHVSMQRRLWFTAQEHQTQPDKLVPLQANSGPYGFRILRILEFLDNQHMKVASLSTLSTSYFNPSRDIPGIHSVRGSVKTKTIVRPKGLNQWKIPETPSGIEPPTYRLVTQSSNRMHSRVTPPDNWSCHHRLLSLYTLHPI